MTSLLSKIRSKTSKQASADDADDKLPRTSSRSSTDKEVVWSNGHLHTRKRSDSHPREPSSDPVEFVKEALAPIFSFSPTKGLTSEQLRESHVDRYFDRGYLHRYNSSVLTADSEGGGSLRVIELLRARGDECKIRFKHETVDQMQAPSLEKAAVGLYYDIILNVKHHSGLSEERRTSVLGIFRIEAGKIISGDLVLDTSPLNSEEYQELDCAIM